MSWVLWVEYAGGETREYRYRKFWHAAAARRLLLLVYGLFGRKLGEIATAIRREP